MIEVKLNSSLKQGRYIACIDHKRKTIINQIAPRDISGYKAWTYKGNTHLITLIWWEE